MTKTVLITGASGGIGYEFAKVFAQNGYNLILVARSTDKLHRIQAELSEKYSIEATVFSHDLAQLEAPLTLFDQVQQAGLTVDVLINNAGFGDHGAFAESNWPKQNQMLQLNVVALTHLTRLFLPGMVARGSGQVMNLASTAAFQPGPFMAVYYATKAYVLSFTGAIANELQGTGVTATALCPGPTKSDFQDRADLQQVEWFQSSDLPTAAEVAQFGYDALAQKRVVAIHKFTNKVYAVLAQLLPQQMMAKLVRRIQGPAQD